MFKKIKWPFLIYAILILWVFGNFIFLSGNRIPTNDIRIRDPFIFVNQKDNTYYMYAQSANRKESGFTGVEVYTSKDLLYWDPPLPVLKLPENKGIQDVWAPEMHEYNGKYYLFVTLTFNKKLQEKKPVRNKNWPEMHVRGTHIYYADSPLGPFKPFKETSHTPDDWMALDGTLYIEDSKPYMVFCHEWVQTIDGIINFVLLEDDLSGTLGKPQLMFKASSAPGAIQEADKGKVTDGCFMYRSPDTGKLFMIWSSFIPGNGYCILLSHSESGKITGPWQEQKIIYTKNGGHGMIFHTFDGTLMVALHQPNTNGKERLQLYRIIDNGNTLSIENN